MKAKQIREVLQQHAFFSGRMIAHSKTGYGRRHPNHLVVFNAKVFTRRGLILQLVDLDLTIDAEKLAAAAREGGENLFVLPEGYPGRFWEPGQSPIAHVLRDAVWWTRIRPEDADVFWPVDATRRPKRLPLACAAGTGESQPAYGTGYWGGCAISQHENTGCQGRNGWPSPQGIPGETRFEGRGNLSAAILDSWP